MSALEQMDSPSFLGFELQQGAAGRWLREARWLLPLASTLGLLLLVACGGRIEPNFDSGRPDAGDLDSGFQDAGPQDAGGFDAGWQDAGTQDAGGQDAGGQDAGGQDAGGQDAGSLPPLRAVISLTDIPAASQSVVSALVSDVFDPSPSPGCTPGNFDQNAVSTAKGYNAGAITVGGLAGGMVVMQPQADANYGTRYGFPGSAPQPLFRGGNTLTADAAGGPDLGPFSVQMATPTAMNLSAPATTGVQQSVSGSLAVRWTPGGGDLVVISLIKAGPFFSPQSGPSLTCVTSDSGSFDIPGSKLSGVLDGNFLGQNALLGVTRVHSSVKLLGAGNEAIFWAGHTDGAGVTLKP